jgi:hypothetical protein
MLDYRLLYLEHLTDTDVAALARIGSSTPDDLRHELASRPDLIDELLGHPDLFTVVDGEGAAGIEPAVSPFLVFSALANRAVHDLAGLTYVAEWTAPRCRLPVFDVVSLREFVEDGRRRYFLVELLTSFTRVAVVAGGTGGRRGGRRVTSELDLTTLATAVEKLPAWQRPSGYRRLGDVALFSCGVFPDHTAAHPVRPSVREELAISAGIEEQPVGGEHDLIFIESVGAGWYRRAVDSAREAVGAVPAFIGDVADHFRQARRVLNFVTDRYLYEMGIGLRPPVL